MHSTPPAVDVMRTRARAQVATEAGAWADAARLWEEVVTANPVNGAW